MATRIADVDLPTMIAVLIERLKLTQSIHEL